MRSPWTNIEILIVCSAMKAETSTNINNNWTGVTTWTRTAAAYNRAGALKYNLTNRVTLNLL